MKQILLSLLITVSAFAQTPRIVEDGSWWKNWPSVAKVTYVSGYIEGSESSNISTMMMCVSLWSELKPVKDAYTFQQWQTVCTPASDYDGIKVGQFVEGLDAFYSDYRNQKIEVGSAIDHVRDEIRGKPRAELDANVEHLRKCYADMKTCFTDSASPTPTPKP